MRPIRCSETSVKIPNYDEQNIRRAKASNKIPGRRKFSQFARFEILAAIWMKIQVFCELAVPGTFLPNQNVLKLRRQEFSSFNLLLVLFHVT